MNIKIRNSNKYQCAWCAKEAVITLRVTDKGMAKVVKPGCDCYEQLQARANVPLPEWSGEFKVSLTEAQKILQAELVGTRTPRLATQAAGF